MRLHQSFSVFLLLLGACASPAGSDGNPVSSTRSPIVDGDLETGEPAVVYVFNRRGGLCSGSLIAPRVVLTAKHCVQSEGASGPEAAPFFLVGVGNEINLRTDSYTVSQVTTTPGSYSTGLNGLTGIDIALLTLSRGISTFEPKGVHRGDALDLVGERVTAIGFGETAAGRSGTKYRQGTVINAVRQGVIYTSPVTCQGDSGGPIILDSTGEVVGITSFGTGQCGSGLAGANRIDLFLDMIDAVVGDSGACLNDGAERCDGFDNDCDDAVDETCLDLGEACVNGAECLGNNCEDTSVGRLCTVACDPINPTLSCPTGLFCSRMGDCDGRCVPLPSTLPTLGNDEPCEADEECESFSCQDPGDGIRRCLVACKGDEGGCLGGEVCAATPGACNGCVPASLVRGSRGLGEPCDDAAECGTSMCTADGATGSCTRVCTIDTDCPENFHCRDSSVCIRGDRQGIGGSCTTNGDCDAGTVCAISGDRAWCTTFCEEEPCEEGFSCVEAGGRMLCSPDLALLGESCGAPEECLTGLCEDVAEDSPPSDLISAATVCTRVCDRDTPCAVGFGCFRQESGENRCVANPEPPAPVPADDGCSAGPTATLTNSTLGSGGSILAVLGFWLLLRRPRRRHR